MWQSRGGELGSRNGLSPSALAECRPTAVGRRREVLGAALPCGEARSRLRGPYRRGTPGAVLVDTARGVKDLLVVGTGSRAPFRRRTRPSLARYGLAHAACPLLVVAPLPLQTELGTVHRRSFFWQPLPSSPALFVLQEQERRR